MDNKVFAQKVKRLYTGTINDFEYHNPTDAENSVCELVSLANEDRKQELIRLIYYFLTQATEQFIEMWLYMLLISLYCKPRDIEVLDESEAAFFASFSKYEISILNKAVNYFLNQNPRIMSQKKKEKLRCYWQPLKKQKEN